LKTEKPEPARIVVLISGSGSNLQAIAEAAARQEFDGEVVAVISNRPEVLGLQRANDFGIKNQVVDHTEYATREEFDANLIRAIDEHDPDLVVLAGFMRILTPDFVRRYKGRMLNIHPSLLPAYPGLNTHQRALEDGVKFVGCTVHFVREEMDVGPIIIQAAVPVKSKDTIETLAARVLAKEHRCLCFALTQIALGNVKISSGKVVINASAAPASGTTNPLLS